MLEFKNVKKQFVENGQVALNVSLKFPNRGLVAVTGKSGCGKSTLINLACLLDEPTSGEIFFNGKNLNKFKNKDKEKYRNEDVGIVFQHFNLLEEHNALFNIALPNQIKGVSYQKSLQNAHILIKKFNLDEKLCKTKVKFLSGGEKQRVAVLRSLINEPKIIFADEPTGALDIKNSVLVMDLLKEISKDRLVILVSHNSTLVKEYADRIITLQDGKLLDDETINKIEEKEFTEPPKKVIRTSSWTSKIALSNFIKRINRNFLSILSLCVGLLSTLLILGFYQGAPISIDNEAKKQFDYGVCTFSKQVSSEIEGSQMSLVQMLRPTSKELASANLKDYTVTYNYDAYLSAFPKITLGEEVLTDFSFKPVYSFGGGYVSPKLLSSGKLPYIDNLYEVVINTKAENILKKKIGGEVVGAILSIKNEYQSNFYTDSDLEPVVIDYFNFEKNVRIVGVVNEISFLNTPKIYYSYKAFEDYLKEIKMNNLSEYFGSEYSWFDRIVDATPNEDISSYSYRCFLRNIFNSNYIKRDVENYNQTYVLESSPYLVESTLKQLIEASSAGMGIFLGICILGTCLILGIVSFSSYVEDRKKIAILSSLGAKKDHIYEVYISENFVIGFIATLISLLCAEPLAKLGNLIIFNTLGFENLLQIPFIFFLGRKYFLLILIVIAVLVICVFSTILPIAFASKISLREELKDE